MSGPCSRQRSAIRRPNSALGAVSLETASTIPVDLTGSALRPTWPVQPMSAAPSKRSLGRYKIDSHWSIKAEYLYVDLGKPNFSPIAVDPVNYAVSLRTNLNIARVGVNYAF
jgi:hypothetical protein